MPTLKNPIHERFACLFASGKIAGLSQAQIFQMAGGTAKNLHSAEAAASRLMQRPDVLARLAELGGPAARKAKLDAETLLGKLETTYLGASMSQQFSHANRSAELMGKMSGLLVDRSEVTTISLDTATTVNGVVSLMLADMSPQDALAGLDELRRLVEESASARATLVKAVEPSS